MGTPDNGFVHRYESGAGSDSPTLLLLHGTGGDETSLLGLGRTLAPGAALLAPRGKVLEGGRPRYFRRLAEGVFDLEDLRVRTHELADFVATASERYGLDPKRVAAVGYSNGANIAASVLLLRPGVLAGAVLLHAQVPLDPDPLPDLGGVPVLLTAGRLDPLVPAAEAERLAELLRRARARLELHCEPGGHELTGGELRTAQAWLEREGFAGSDTDSG